MERHSVAIQKAVYYLNDIQTSLGPGPNSGACEVKDNIYCLTKFIEYRKEEAPQTVDGYGRWKGFVYSVFHCKPKPMLADYLFIFVEMLI